MVLNLVTIFLTLLVLAAAPAAALDGEEDCTHASPRTMALCQLVQESRARKARLDHQFRQEIEDARAQRRQRTEAVRASLAEYRRKLDQQLATMPLDHHTVVTTWTDHRGHTHRTETTCTFYQSKTECHTR